MKTFIAFLLGVILLSLVNNCNAERITRRFVACTHMEDVTEYLQARKNGETQHIVYLRTQRGEYYPRTCFGGKPSAEAKMSVIERNYLGTGYLKVRLLLPSLIEYIWFISYL